MTKQEGMAARRKAAWVILFKAVAIVTVGAVAGEFLDIHWRLVKILTTLPLFLFWVFFSVTHALTVPLALGTISMEEIRNYEAPKTPNAFERLKIAALLAYNRALLTCVPVAVGTPLAFLLREKNPWFVTIPWAGLALSVFFLFRLIQANRRLDVYTLETNTSSMTSSI